MKTSKGILANMPKHFAQITAALKLESGSPDFQSAHQLWSQLAAGIEAPPLERDLRAAVRLEQALVWRILLLRMLRELGAQAIFQERNKGAATGTASTHPALDALAKTYERLIRTMDELTPEPKTQDPASATGLPMRMLKVLEETEGFLEHALGLKPGEKSAFSPRLRRRDDRTGGQTL